MAPMRMNGRQHNCSCAQSVVELSIVTASFHLPSHSEGASGRMRHVHMCRIRSRWCAVDHSDEHFCSLLRCWCSACSVIAHEREQPKQTLWALRINTACTHSTTKCTAPVQMIACNFCRGGDFCWCSLSACTLPGPAAVRIIATAEGPARMRLRLKLRLVFLTSHMWCRTRQSSSRDGAL